MTEPVPSKEIAGEVARDVGTIEAIETVRCQAQPNLVWAEFKPPPVPSGWERRITCPEPSSG